MHPDVALSQLHEGAIDVAVVFRYDDAVPDDMQFQHLFDDPMYLISRRRADSRRSPGLRLDCRVRTMPA